MDSLPNSQYYLFAGNPATGSIVFKQTPAPVNGNTITINGQPYTYGTDWTCGSGSNAGYAAALSARRFAAAVNGESDDSRYSLGSMPNKDVFARAMGSTVLLFSRVPGVAGNGIGVTTSTASAFALSGAALSGGVGEGIQAKTTPPETESFFAALTGGESQVITAGGFGWTFAVLSGTASISTVDSNATGLPAGFADTSETMNSVDITITASADSLVYVRWEV